MLSEIKTSLGDRIDNIATMLDNTIIRIDSNETKIDEVAARVSAVEGIIENLNINPVSHDSNFVARKCMSEMISRESRKKNLILFGFPEPDTSNASNNVFHSVSGDVLIAFFSNIIPNNMFENSKHFRLGKLSQDQSKPRPLKIIFESEERARQVFRTFLTVKADSKFSEKLKALWMSLDRTKMQVEELSVLRGELKQRVEAGETDITIGYRGGIPRIIKRKSPELPIPENV